MGATRTRSGHVPGQERADFKPPRKGQCAADKDCPARFDVLRKIRPYLQPGSDRVNPADMNRRFLELDEQTLDILAYDLHVDWYDHSYPIEVKRQTIKDSVKIHRRLGTRRCRRRGRTRGTVLQRALRPSA